MLQRQIQAGAAVMHYTCIPEASISKISQDTAYSSWGMEDYDVLFFINKHIELNFYL